MWKQIDNDTEIFETPDRIEAAKKDLASDSREQLLKKIHIFQGSDDHRKAAILLLAEMDKNDLDEKHKEILKTAKSTNLWAMGAFFVGIISVLVLLKDCAGISYLISPLPHQKPEELKPKIEQSQSTKAIPEFENVQNRKQPLQIEPIKK